MKSLKDLHAAAAAKLEQLERAFDKLFVEVNADPDGEKHWTENYQSRYDAMDRMENAAYRAYWYTDPQNSRKIKQCNHRLTVAKMRAAGLHRMATVKK